MSRGDAARRNAYLREFIPALLVYAIAITSGTLLVDADNPYLWAWMLLPMLPLLWVIRAVARDLGRADEFARMVQLQGMAVGLAAAMSTSLTVGLLGIAQVVTPAAGWISFSAGMAAWAATSVRLGGSTLRTRR